MGLQGLLIFFFIYFFFFNVRAYGACRPLREPKMVDPGSLVAQTLFFLSDTSCFRGSCCSTRLCRFPALGRVMGSMRLFLGHSAITEKSETFAESIRIRVPPSSPTPVHYHSATPTTASHFMDLSFSPVLDNTYSVRTGDPVRAVTWNRSLKGTRSGRVIERAELGHWETNSQVKTSERQLTGIRLYSTQLEGTKNYPTWRE